MCFFANCKKIKIFNLQDRKKETDGRNKTKLKNRKNFKIIVGDIKVIIYCKIVKKNRIKINLKK
jgi:hypothetical protein